jgi:hypothetical protein
MRDQEDKRGMCDYCKAFDLGFEELTTVRHWDACGECLERAQKEEDSRQLWYTTAPEAYDGFGTETEETLGPWHRQDMRRVSILGAHLEWQQCRYGSGCHFYSQELPYDYEGGEQ